MTLIETLFAEIIALREKYSAMCEEDSYHESSPEGFAISGEIDGLLRAVTLTPALTLADCRVKNAVLRDRCGEVSGRLSAVELTDQIPLAASLLDDINAILKDEFALAA
jgi:hypothetical protein